MAAKKITSPGRSSGERRIYVSKEYCAWAKSWVDGFWEKLVPIGFDDFDNEVKVILPPEIPDGGGIKTVDRRDLRMGVTDVVVIFTSGYIAKQQRLFEAGKASELLCFIERKESEDGDSLTLWLAPLESLKLRNYELGGKRLRSYPWWHWLKGEEQAFRFLGPSDDLRFTAGFIQDLDEAVARLLAHAPIRCEQCGRTDDNALAGRQISE